ncbi:MAG: hypothetical protein N0E43_03465 [Candidatus Thiodiazotropha lotti]|nr:hypothetical protein [Candidatus Thiodiazotropha lotti]MCW4206615.1 hypothetical protein [Candidatus Thiodiazotropha lotti]MCW4217742.1 hypothetical protein [Candidatus Thiodiazotropha lotti]
MSAKILEFRPKTSTHPVREMVLQEQADIVRANDHPGVFDMPWEVRDIFEDLARVLGLNCEYLYENCSTEHNAFQTLLISQTRIVARLKLLFPE